MLLTPGSHWGATLSRYQPFSVFAGPFEDMFYLIGFAIGRKQEDLFHDLEIALIRHKPDFIALLQNPVSYSAKIIEMIDVDGCVNGQEIYLSEGSAHVQFRQ